MDSDRVLFCPGCKAPVASDGRVGFEEYDTTDAQVLALGKHSPYCVQLQAVRLIHSAEQESEVSNG